MFISRECSEESEVVKKLILVRGLPGSGKSTYAKKLGIKHLEADMFFETKGSYTFDPTKLKEAHEWCKNHTRASLIAGDSVVVSNTFTMKWEAQPYLEMAKELGAKVEIVVCDGNYESIHNVPLASIDRMRSRWEKISTLSPCDFCREELELSRVWSHDHNCDFRLCSECIGDFDPS